ncbi:nicotinate-nucleotide--dimethylbenzimidazole phosphoribosyltransferase [soil metagenome]
MTPVAPSAEVHAAATARLADLATPAGALGRLGDLAVWVSATQGVCPPRALENIRAVIFAGDHGVSDFGVSAYPKAITPAMVYTFLSGGAGVSVLARQHGVSLRVLDIGVDDDLSGAPAEVKAYKVRRSSGAIHLEDALTPAETQRALEVGALIAREEIAAGAQLLIAGDMGIGNTTPTAAMIAAVLGLPASEVTGRGTGVAGDALVAKEGLIAQALERTRGRTNDPIEILTALGSADLAAGVGFLIEAAASGVPVLLDGVISVANALLAEEIAPGSAAWFAAGHRSPEPAQSLALSKLGLEPILDLGMRLGEGSGAMAAVPVLRSAVALLGEMTLLSELQM